MADCDECGERMRPEDSGHGSCLYCRLPDLLEHAYQRGREDAARWPGGSTLEGGPA